MCKRTVVLLLILLLALTPHAWSEEGHPTAKYDFLRDHDFWLSTGVNLMGIGLFVSRVHAPNSSKWFGYGTQLLGLPALGLGLTDVIQGTTDLSTWADFGYAAWALGAVVIDHVLGVEYRDPVRPEILIPYVVSYYLTVGFQAAVQLDKGIVPWAIAGTACIANVAASIYARPSGAD